MNQMFCFQCEQTAGGKACQSAQGVCGKKAEVAQAQDQVTAALITLAQAAADKQAPTAANRLFTKALFATLTNVSFDPVSLAKTVQAVQEQTAALGGTPTFDINTLWNAPEDIRSLKSTVLFAARGIAAYAFHAAELGYEDDAIYAFLYKALAAVATEEDGGTLLALALEAGKANYACMELLEKANTETYGQPQPTEVPLTIEAGPFIVVSGHDLHDLQLVLEQTEGKNINVYTHGEMLPAHAYPKLKAHAHLKGHFGGAWFKQHEDFYMLPGSIVMTSNCLMPIEWTYSDRIYTTGPVEYPGIMHIEEGNFFPAVLRSQFLHGWKQDELIPGANGGSVVTTGFGKDAILGKAQAIIDAVKAGELKHIFLIGGCDGPEQERSYYTELAKQTPKDSIILTLGCGKFRLLDLDLGTVAGLPRVLDMGQCNDAYGAIQVALALANAFECSVNDLPLSLALSWYEQKAVSILLTLLDLGVKDIYLGPKLPAFLSPQVGSTLIEQYQLHPISTPEADLAAMLKK